MRIHPILCIPVLASTRVLVRRGSGICRGISVCFVWWHYPTPEPADVTYILGYGRRALFGVWLPELTGITISGSVCV